MTDSLRHDLDASRSALLVIDMQNDFVEPGAPMEIPSTRALLPILSNAIDELRRKGMLVVYTRQVNATDGSDLGVLRDCYPHIVRADGTLCALAADTRGVEIHDDLRPSTDDLVVDKPSFSAFAHTDLEDQLQSRGIDTLVIAGCVTNGCCEATARDAVGRGFRVVLADDGTATRDLPDLGWGAVSEADAHRVTKTTMAFSYGEVYPLASIIANIGVSAGTARTKRHGAKV